jgi:hypothetical protein
MLKSGLIGASNVSVFSSRTPRSTAFSRISVRVSSPAAVSTVTLAATCATISPRCSRLRPPVVRLPPRVSVAPATS